MPPSHIIHSSGYRGENPTGGLSVLFVVLCPMNALVTQSHYSSPRIPCLQVALKLKLKLWNLKNIRQHYVRVSIRTQKPNIFNSGGPYWNNIILFKPSYSMYRKLSSGNKCSFITYIIYVIFFCVKILQRPIDWCHFRSSSISLKFGSTEAERCR